MSTMCSQCQSKQTTQKKHETKIVLYCRMCRRETILIEGTAQEIARYHTTELAMKRRRRAEDRKSRMQG